MPRNRSIQQGQYPYHITGRCINKEWFNLPMQKVWEVFCEELHMTNILHNLKIHSFVLMRNHYHLIARTPDANISKSMHRFSLNVSLRLTGLGNRINETFAGRHFKTVLQDPSYYLNCYKYVYRNPVEAGACKKVENYKFSTLNAKLGQSKLLCPIEHDDTLFDNSEGCLDWLNSKPKQVSLDSVRYALRRPYFKPLKNRVNGKPLIKIGELI